MSSTLRLSLLAITMIALVIAGIVRAEANVPSATNGIGVIELPQTDLAGIRCESGVSL